MTELQVLLRWRRGSWGLSHLPAVLAAKPFRPGFPLGRITRKQVWPVRTFLSFIVHLKFVSATVGNFDTAKVRGYFFFYVMDLKATYDQKKKKKEFLPWK